MCGELIQHIAIIRRVDHDGNGLVVLGGGAHHGRSADVDVLHRVLVAAARLGNRRREGVQIHGQQIDGVDFMLTHDRIINAAPAEQPAVDFRMQGFHPPVHDFRKASVLGHFLDGHAVLHE
jgi:hypothetical protein